MHLLHQLGLGDLDALSFSPEERVQEVISLASKTGPLLITADNILQGNNRLNLLLLGMLFTHKNGLFLDESQKEAEVAELINFDAEGDREERAFCNWMTSLGVPVRSIVEDLRDGLKILETLQIISPGIVDWKKVNKAPKNTYTKVENTNYAVSVGKKLQFSMVGIAGKDFLDGNRKLILAMVWQMMKLHLFSILKRINDSGRVEKDVIDWANRQVTAAGKATHIKDYQDSTLSTSLFLIDLLAALRPKMVDYSLVTSGQTGNGKIF